MSNKEEREYYTFAEIINCLREPYKKSQSILDEMKELVQVDFDSIYDAYFILRMKGEVIENPEVFLKVSKKPDYIFGSRIINAMAQLYYNDFGQDIYSAVFKVIESNDGIEFKQVRNRYLDYNNQPNVIIPDSVKDKLLGKYKELKNSDLYNLSSIYKIINPFQTLSIYGDYISLTNKDGLGNEISISYWKDDDNIYINSSKKYPTYFIEELLSTKISKYELPDEYITLFDKNDNKLDLVFIEDIIGKRKEKLSINEDSKKLVLKKKE